MRSSLLVVAALGFVAACNSTPFGLLPATQQNREDTVTVYALVGTSISVPSAYSMSDRVPVRTDQTTSFDFGFNITPQGRAALLPIYVLGLGASGTASNPGFLPTTDAWENLTQAPLNGYITRDTQFVAPRSRYYVRSRVVCTSYGVPLYAKLEVLSVDTVARAVTFRVVNNANCGYRGLAPGLPTN